MLSGAKHLGSTPSGKQKEILRSLGLIECGNSPGFRPCGLEPSDDLPFEQFPALSAIGICRHAFTQRIPGIDVSHDKGEVLKRLDAAHREIRNAIGMGDWPLFTAQQIHGNKIAVIDSCSHGPVGREFPGCDGLITNQRGIVLGVYVADCCAVYIVDQKTHGYRAGSFRTQRHRTSASFPTLSSK